MIVPNNEIIQSFGSLSREDLILLVIFYKNKNADLELSYLKLQIDESNKFKKSNLENKQNLEKMLKEKEDILKYNDEHLKKEIEKLNKKIESSSKKKQVLK